MAINLDAIGCSYDLGSRTWDSSDAILYALGVGAGADDSVSELAFTTENSTAIEQKVLPTFGVALASREPIDLGDYHQRQVLHADQTVTLPGPIPVEGEAHTTSTVLGIYDKGRDATVVIESTVTDPGNGKTLASACRTLFIRGEGGFGGERGKSEPWATPGHPPDEIITYRTAANQALLYRLNGDRNPLHSDPVVANQAGYPQPILHGLCSYGYAGRALLHTMCDSDPAQFGTMSVRFSAPAWPGETLRIEMWRTEDGCRFRGRVDDRIVLDRGEFIRRS